MMCYVQGDKGLFLGVAWYTTSEQHYKISIKNVSEKRQQQQIAFPHNKLAMYYRFDHGSFRYIFQCVQFNMSNIVGV